MEMTHQPESLLAVLVENDGESLQVYDALAFPELREQRVQGIHERLLLDLFQQRLCECNHGISYCPVSKHGKSRRDL